MSSSAAEKAANMVLTPRSSGERKPQHVSVTTSAAEVDIWNTPLGATTSLNRGKFWVTLKASGGDVYIWFKTGSSATSITSSNGYQIKDGTIEYFWVDSQVDTYLEHIGSASCTLIVTITSPVAEKPSGVL